MHSFKKTITEFLLITFLLWHMGAVAVYAIPTGAHGPLVDAVRDTVKPHIRGYIQLTSQWQQWNLFSPNPLRRVTQFTVDWRDGWQWREYKTITAETLPWYEQSVTLKTLRRLENEPKRGPLREGLLRSVCDENPSLEGREIRLRSEYAVMPQREEYDSVFWEKWKPNWKESSVDTVFCDSPPSQSQSS